jgi:predicted DCC family thiol-disulfide oxidoreductase YuxK
MAEKLACKSLKLPHNKWVLFDGDCGLCHWAVRFISPKDRNKNFCFVPLNSSFGIQLLRERGIYLEEKSKNALPLNSVILIDPNKAYYIKSEAVIQILKLLPNWYFVNKGFLL